MIYTQPNGHTKIHPPTENITVSSCDFVVVVVVFALRFVVQDSEMLNRENSLIIRFPSLSLFPTLCGTVGMTIGVAVVSLWL